MASRESDISSGMPTINPFFESDRKKRARWFLVQGQLTLKVRDFTKLEPILENSVDDGIADFRSLTYSLSDDEAAKAERHAWDRANAALSTRGQKDRALRFVNVDANQLTCVSEIFSTGWTVERYDPGAAGDSLPAKNKIPPATPPLNQPKKNHRQRYSGVRVPDSIDTRKNLRSKKPRRRGMHP